MGLQHKGIVSEWQGYFDSRDNPNTSQTLEYAKDKYNAQIRK
jgi:hypothetical protein